MRSLLLTMSLLVIGGYHAQTNLCNNNAAGEIIPGASCTYSIWDSDDNNNYWTSAVTDGSCNESTNDDVWAWFTAASTTTTINYDPFGTGDPIVTVFSGACSATGVPVACADLGGSSAIETITMSTVPGTVYHIRIQNFSSNATMLGDLCVVGTSGGGTTTASDCSAAVNVCTDLSFQIDPNGFGTINEIPASGTVSNPDTNPGSSNMGCLLVGEYNSTWMIVNVATSGLLEFTIGAGGAQAGYYDWIMYPYSGAATCAAIQANTIAPVRCNWNLVDNGGTGVVASVPSGGDPGNYEPPLAVTGGQQYLICFSNYSNSNTSVPLNFLTGAGDAGVSCTPLGFKLTDLLVECLDDFRAISWKVPVENNISTMTLQKSRDGANWESLQSYTNGEVGSDNFMKFNYYDQSETNVLGYYRVKQTLDDGEIAFTNVISGDCNLEDDKLMVYPNPANDLLTVEYQSLNGSVLEFYNLAGEKVYQVSVPSAENGLKLQVNIAEVKNGIYILKMVLGDEAVTQKIVVSH